MVVRPDGLSHSSVRKTHGSNAVRRDFTAAQPSAEHQGAHNSLLGVVVPMRVLQLVSKSCSCREPVVEGAAEEPNARRGMGP